MTFNASNVRQSTLASSVVCPSLCSPFSCLLYISSTSLSIEWSFIERWFDYIMQGENGDMGLDDIGGLVLVDRWLAKKDKLSAIARRNEEAVALRVRLLSSNLYVFYFIISSFNFLILNLFLLLFSHYFFSLAIFFSFFMFSSFLAFLSPHFLVSCLL